MGISVGPFNLLKLIFGILNILLKKDIVSYEETRGILSDAIDDPSIAQEKKEEILNSIIKRTHNGN